VTAGGEIVVEKPLRLSGRGVCSENDCPLFIPASSIGSARLFELAEVYPDPAGLGRMAFTFGRPRLPLIPLGIAGLGDRGKGRTSLTPNPSPPIFLGRF